MRWTGTATDVHDQRHAAKERELLSRASEIFARPLDLEATLGAIASFAVPEIGDWCEIDVGTEDGGVKTVAIAHRDAASDRVAQRLVGRTHLNPQGATGTYVIRTGKPQLVSQAAPEIVDRTAGDEEAARRYREFGVGSFVAVPLVAEGQRLGSLAVVYGRSGRRYSPDDVPMLEELGRRAGLALHKARLSNGNTARRSRFKRPRYRRSYRSLPA